MRSTIKTAFAILAMGLLAMGATPASAQHITRSYWCKATDYGKHVAYYSKIFQGDEQENNRYAHEFYQYLQGAYGASTQAYCFFEPKEEYARNRQTGDMSVSRSGFTVQMVDWSE